MPSPNGNHSELALTPQEVALLTRGQRHNRIAALIRESVAILDSAKEEFVDRPGKELVATCAMFSGGHDSTVMTHLFRDRVTHAIHANTTIGIEATRQFVRDTCRLWDLQLLEHAPNISDQYRTLVLERGFPGPGMHMKMYQRLKERAFHKARRDLVENGRRQRVIFLAGRRRTESTRRAFAPAVERDGSIVWVSPMINWTKLDLNAYRSQQTDLPTNPVSDLLHMSGECLCGAFAHLNELDEIAQWYPDVADEIHALERAIADRTDIPGYRKTWGWGANRALLEQSRSRDRRETAGRLCSACVLDA